ncbi:MAG TPA: ATPase [Sphingomicrobium sp.]|nr:ATPase [Sphingomicrobium sp.]
MKIFIAVALIAAPAPAAAEVVSASTNGFEVRQTVNLVVPPELAFETFRNVAAWWDSEHTYGGKAANLSLSLSPGACVCERLPEGGGIEHMRVTYVDPGKRVVLTGSLGPHLYEATTGVMDVQVKSQAGGSQLVLDYRAAGFFNGGAEKMAPLVDQVLAEQMKRFRAYVTARPRN